MKTNRILWLALVVSALLILISMPTLSQFRVAPVSTGSGSIGTTWKGEVQWSTDTVMTPVSVLPSPVNFKLDASQERNLVARGPATLVMLVEEYYRGRALQSIFSQHMLSNTALTLRNVDRGIIVLNPAGNELYFSKGIRVVQTTAGCAKGKVCFDLFMYGSTGSLIETRKATVFPDTTTMLTINPDFGPI